ncbi:Riboflavin transporter FmnP [Ruminococcaceae bacterium YAD3003]|nr:Riboflavin transporter FmnP [Ruminococcaceae bacterium YAD3003]
MTETHVTVKADSRVARKIMLRRIAACAILTAMAVLLMYLEIPLPFMPSFLKFDFSELPVLIGSFALGPVWGIVIELLKNLIHLPVTQTMGIGELSNFITGVIYVGTAGIIYRIFVSKKGAAIAMIIATLVLAAVSVPVNAFLTLPLYGSVMGFPLEAIIGMSAAVNPLVKDKLSLLLAVFVPFNLFKGFIVAGITYFVHLPLSKLINKTYNATHDPATT